MRITSEAVLTSVEQLSENEKQTVTTERLRQLLCPKVGNIKHEIEATIQNFLWTAMKIFVVIDEAGASCGQ